MAESKLEREGIEFIERFHRIPDNQLRAAKADGAKLASRLRNGAIDLCMDKATEFSPDIGTLFELAAKVALLAHWPNEEALAQFEKDVGYTYGNVPRSEKHARGYDRFRREYLGSRS